MDTIDIVLTVACGLLVLSFPTVGIITHFVATCHECGKPHRVKNMAKVEWFHSYGGSYRSATCEKCEAKKAVASMKDLSTDEFIKKYGGNKDVD